MLVLTVGCGAPRGERFPVSTDSNRGDWVHSKLDEMVFSLRFRGAAGPYQNLHVGLSAFVNSPQGFPTDPFALRPITKRCEGRIAAQLVRVTADVGEQSAETMQHLRELLTAEAQSVANETLKNGRNGPEYRVEIVVTSLYWTDPSVGAREPSRRFLWE